MITRQVFYEGKVQGVGFRYTVKRIATGYDVVGWIRNLQDGRVEMQTEGEAEEIADFLKAVEESELQSHIFASYQHEISALNNVRGFEIRSDG